MFEKIVGNESVKHFLQKRISSGTLSHALLFSGPKGVGKSLFAREVACHLLQTSQERLHSHPDFHLLLPDGKSGLHSIEAMRELIDLVHKAPFAGVARVFLVEEIERMLPTSANALLKTLEEPTASTYFIFLSARPKDLLPTIVSRLTEVYFSSEGVVTNIGFGEPLEKFLFPILTKELSWAESAVRIKEMEEAIEKEEPPKKGELIEQIFSVISMWARDKVASEYGASLLLPEIHGTKGKPHFFQEIEKRIKEAKEAYQRNIRLSTCLEHVLS